MANQKGPKKPNKARTTKKIETMSLAEQMGNNSRLSSNVSVRIHVQSKSFDLPFNVENKNS